MVLKVSQGSAAGLLTSHVWDERSPWISCDGSSTRRSPRSSVTRSVNAGVNGHLRRRSLRECRIWIFANLDESVGKCVHGQDCIECNGRCQGTLRTEGVAVVWPSGPHGRRARLRNARAARKEACMGLTTRMYLASAGVLVPVMSGLQGVYQALRLCRSRAACFRR